MKSNKEKLINRLQSASAGLKAELQYYLGGVDREEGNTYDLSDAFNDYVSLAIDEAGEKTHIKEVRKIYLDIGFAVTRDQNTVTIGSGKKYWFKENGVEYDSIDAWERWLTKA